MFSELFIIRGYSQIQNEPARKRAIIEQLWAEGRPTSFTDRVMERLFHEQYVQLTGEHPLLPSFLQNIVVRPFWRRGVPRALSEDRWLHSRV